MAFSPGITPIERPVFAKWRKFDSGVLTQSLNAHLSPAFRVKLRCSPSKYRQFLIKRTFIRAVARSTFSLTSAFSHSSEV